MKTEKFSGEISNFYGKPLSELQTTHGNPVVGSLSFAGDFTAYENIGEIRTSNAFPSDDEIVKMVNDKRKNQARAKSMLAAVDAAGIVKPTLENDDQLKLKKMYEIFVSAKKSHEEARALSSAALGIEWAE